MRCPQCHKRNSVAAKICGECGQTFKRKPIPFQLKFFAGFVAALLLLSGIAFVMAPKLGDETVTLSRAAKALAAGPKSQSDATRLIGEFDQAMTSFLKHSGNLSIPSLTKELQAHLPSSLSEVHIFDLTRGFKLVEIDNALSVTDYLVWTKSGETKVLPVPGLEVVDDNAIVEEPSGKFLVLLGHTAGQTSHRPKVKVYAIVADDLTDQTDGVVPPLPGNGDIAFARNRKDLFANLSLLSIGQSEGIFATEQKQPFSVEDEPVRYFLDWQNGHYFLQASRGNSKLFALSCLIKCLKDPSSIDRYQYQISTKAKKDLRALGDTPQKDLNFVIQPGPEIISGRMHTPGSVQYVLANPQMQVKVELERRTQGMRNWIVTSFKVQSQGAPAVAEAVEEKPNANETTPEKPTIKKEEQPIVQQPTETEKPRRETTTTENVEPATPEPEAEKRAETTTESTVASNTSPGQATVRCSSGSAILRSGPGTTFSAIDEITKAATIQVIGQEKSWYKVRANGKEGYIYAGLLEYKQPDACTVATIKRSNGVTDDQNRQLASLQTGDRLVVLGGIKNNKYKVQLANGKVGYVDKDALDVTVEAPPFVP